MALAEEKWGSDTPILIHSDAIVTDAEGKTLYDSFFEHQGWDSNSVTLNKLLVQNNATGCTMLLNAPLRELVLQYGKPEDMVMHDWFVAMTAAAFGRVVCTEEALLRYRQHGGNVMGASEATQLGRAARVLRTWQKGKDRMALTYANAMHFSQAYGDALPDAAKETLTHYLALEKRWKPLRWWGYWHGGYTMQSFVTKIGQIVFG